MYCVDGGGSTKETKKTQSRREALDPLWGSNDLTDSQELPDHAEHDDEHITGPGKNLSSAEMKVTFDNSALRMETIFMQILLSELNTLIV